MRLKSLQIMAMLLMYSPALVLGNTHATICITEQGKVQIELGLAICDISIPEAASSQTSQDCGDCTDSKIKIGDTHRVVINNAFDFLTSPPILALVMTDQQAFPTAINFEPSAPVSNLVGSSILIV